MKHYLVLIPFALLTGAATSAQQTVKILDCTADGTKSTSRIRIGPGEYSVFDSAKGQWGANACTDAKDCKYKGAEFTAGNGPEVFMYNVSTRHYVTASIFGDELDHGKCVPE